jgi:esterase/lipase superfamily enzyme
MPTPVAFKSGEHDPFQEADKNENISDTKDNIVTVAYATNRLPANTNKKPYYSKKYDEQLRMGVVTLRIGPEGLLWKDLHAVSTTAERSEKLKISIEKVSPMGSIDIHAPLDEISDELRQYFNIINRVLEVSVIKDITIYAHGANNGFYRSTAQGAQYQYFTGRNAPVIVFSWPSAENFINYSKDVVQARESAPVFARFIELIAHHTNAEKINILSYSAGSRLLDRGMTVLGEKYLDQTEKGKNKLRLGEVYFSAPDVQQETFLTSLPKYLHLTDNVTVTINNEDSVLNIAHKFKGNTRLGRPDKDAFKESENREWFVKAINSQQLDVINVSASKIPEFNKGAHDYWYGNPWVSTDLLMQLNFHARPSERGLRDYETEFGSWIWYFPPDYNLRVIRALGELGRQNSAE